MMTIAVVLSLFIIAAAAVFVLAPRALLGWSPEHVGWGLLILGSAGRVLIGLCFFFAGMTAHWPDFIQVVGGVVILAGLALPFLGPRRFDALLQWVQSLRTGVLRAYGVLAVAFGVLLLVGLAG